jgi:hypothetical protein
MTWLRKVIKAAGLSKGTKFGELKKGKMGAPNFIHVHQKTDR